MKKSIAVGVVAAAIVFGGGTTAFAAAPASVVGTALASPDSQCSGSLTVYRSSASTAFTQASGPNSSVVGSTGVTIGISTSTTFTVGGSITASSTVSASAAIASVSATYGATITATKSGTTTSSGSWMVPASYQIGRLSIGAFKYRGLTTRYLENSACVLVKLGTSASFNAPRNEWAFITSKVS